MQSNSTIFHQIKELIAQNELDTAISLLQVLLKGSSSFDETILQSARHKAILKQVRLGVVDEKTANLTQNQIQKGILDLIRELENNQNILIEEISEYKQIIEKIETNRGAGTSELLKNKTTDDLDEKEITRLFEKERVIRIFDELEVSPTDFNTHQKLRYLSLAENGHIFKGTFLSLGKRNQIQTICHTATESKFIFFKGTDRTEILVLETLNGNLLQQFEKMLMLLRTHIPLGRDREKNEDRYEIPMLAIREFVANAFVHRDFSAEVQSYIQIELFDDRLEIKSPGHLPKNLDVNKIEGTILVNPVVAAVFHLYKYIERAGTGIQVAQQTLQNNHLQMANIENINHPNMVKVTVFRNKQHENAKNKGGFFDNILKGLKGINLFHFLSPHSA
jgi:predicted HTH transcriptional regulator